MWITRIRKNTQTKREQNVKSGTDTVCFEFDLERAIILFDICVVVAMEYHYQFDFSWTCTTHWRQIPTEDSCTKYEWMNNFMALWTFVVVNAEHGADKPSTIVPLSHFINRRMQNNRYLKKGFFFVLSFYYYPFIIAHIVFLLHFSIRMFMWRAVTRWHTHI